MSQRVRGGPLDGRVLPEGVIPWTAWIPRERDFAGSARNLTPEEVFSQPHYVRYGDTHVWTEPRVFYVEAEKLRKAVTTTLVQDAMALCSRDAGFRERFVREFVEPVRLSARLVILMVLPLGGWCLRKRSVPWTDHEALIDELIKRRNAEARRKANA